MLFSTHSCINGSILKRCTVNESQWTVDVGPGAVTLLPLFPVSHSFCTTTTALRRHSQRGMHSLAARRRNTLGKSPTNVISVRMRLCGGNMNIAIIYWKSNLRRIWWELLERIKNVKLRRLTLCKAFTKGEIGRGGNL